MNAEQHRRVFRTYHPKDRDGVFDLVQAVYGQRGISSRYWDWRYFANPVGETEVFVAADADRIIGMQPMAVLPALWCGQSVRAALYTGAMVHPNYRRQGVFSSLVRICDEHAVSLGASLAMTFPNENSYPAFCRLANWSDAGTMELWVRVIKPTELLTTRSTALRFFGKLLGLSAWPMFAYRPRRRRRSANICCVDRFDDRYESVVKKVGRHQKVFLFHRSAAYLNWRFVDHPEEKYLRLGWIEHGAVLGYVVVNLRVYMGLPIAFVVDLVAQDDRIANELLDAALSMSLQQGAALAAATATHRLTRLALQSAGFWQVGPEVTPKNFYVVYRTLQPMPGGPPGPIRKRQWYLLLGDTDNI